MKLEDFMTMKNSTYHEKVIEYNMKACMAELRKEYPDLTPQAMQLHAAEINKSVWAPKFHGDLPETLGIKDKVLTIEMWREISAGYCPAEWLTDDSPLKEHVIDTPRGPMVKLNHNALPINEDGSFGEPADKAKGRAMGTEFMFSTGTNLSKTLARMMIADPEFEVEFKKIVDEALERIMEDMKELAYIRLGKDGIELQYAKEIMAVSFMHIENRAIDPYIHIHFDTINTALSYNDGLGALYSGYITENKAMLSADFMSYMKEGLEKKFGFVFEEVYLREDEKNEYLRDEQRNITSYDLPDSAVPKNVREFFNTRSEEMAQKLKEEGKGGFLAKEHARLTSRDDKAELSPSEMKALWKKDFEDLGWTVDDIKKHLDFDQVHLNKAQLTDKQLTENFTRKFQEQAQARYGKKTSKEIIAEENLDADAQEFIDNVSDAVRKQETPAERDTKAFMKKVEESVKDEEKQKEIDKDLVTGFLRKTKEVCFTEAQFKGHMVIQLLKTHDREGAEREAARIFEEQCVQMLDKDKIPYYKEFLLDEITDPFEYRQKQIRYAGDIKFTTMGILQQEREISDTLKSRQHETHFQFSDNEATLERLKFEEKMSQELNTNVQFSKGQLAAFHKTLTDTGAVSVIQGAAGAGKTFAMRALKEAYEEKGMNVWGLAPSSTATEGLGKDAQIKEGQCYNLSEMLVRLDAGDIEWNKNTVILGDEMAMVGLDQFHRLVQHANKAQAKLVLCGDHLQIQAVEHGATFRVLSEQFTAQRITEINRQRNSVHREAVQDMADGQAHKSMRALYDMGSIIVVKTEKEKFEKLASDYIADTQPEQNKIALSLTNAECDKFNTAIRDQKKAKGELQGKEVQINCKDGQVRNFAVGDRIVFTKANKSNDMQTHKIKNSEIGTIIKFRDNKLTGGVAAIQIQLDNGKTVWKKTDEDELPVKWGYVVTVHKAQGATRENEQWGVSADINNLHLAYVAVSRSKGGIKIYLSEEMADKMEQKLQDHEPTEQMKKVAQWVSKTQNVAMEPDTLNSFLATRAFLNEHHYTIEKGGEFETHPMDRFNSVIQAMSKTAFKKSTFDFQVIDGKAVNAYREIKQERKQMLETKQEVVRTPEQTPDRITNPALEGEKVAPPRLLTAAQERFDEEVRRIAFEAERRKQVIKEHAIS